MSARLYADLDPLLRESIGNLIRFDNNGCGCHLVSSKPNLIRLCDYHEGFEDGLDAASVKP